MDMPAVFVVQAMRVKCTIMAGDQTKLLTLGPRSLTEILEATVSRSTLLHAGDEVTEGGITELQVAVQAPGDWQKDPRIRGEFYYVREVTADEVFVSCDRVLILRPREVIFVTGSLGLDLFLHEHGKQFADAMSYLEQTAHDLLLEAVGADYWQCFGASWPDALVDVCWESLKTIDITSADVDDILALATSVIWKIPPPHPDSRSA